MVPIEYESGNERFAKLPKVGEEAVFDIKEARKVEGGRYNFTRKVQEEVTSNDGIKKTITVDEDLGYHYEFTLQDGRILPISSWSPYYAFRNAGVNDGMKIKVSHPDKGIWEIEVLEKKTTTEDTEDTEDTPPFGE